MIMHALLAYGLLSRAGVVDGTNSDGILALHKRVSNIEGEGHIATDMLAHVLAVDPNLGNIVAGTDMQDGTSSVLPALGERQLLAVPYAITEILVANARKLTFTAEGDGNGFGKFCAVLVASLLTAFAAVGLVFPYAVEIDPLISHELRAGIFGTGDVVTHMHDLAL